MFWDDLDNVDYKNNKIADLLNFALFNCTAKDWREVNPDLAKKSMNIRDIAKKIPVDLLVYTLPMYRKFLEQDNEFATTQQTFCHELNC